MLIVGLVCFILFIISLVILEGIMYNFISFIDPEKFLLSMSEKDRNKYELLTEELSRNEELFKFYWNIMFKLLNVIFLIPFILLSLSFLFCIL